MGLLDRWRNRREARHEAALIEEIFEEEFGRPNVRKLRNWRPEKLHGHLTDSKLTPAERSMAESELRRREAWAAPAGRAF
jgi:hypothetical protein